MSKNFEIEGDLSLRCFVIKRTHNSKAQFLIPYALWNEFVTFIADIGTNRSQGRGTRFFPQIIFSKGEK